jgi:hypothetical protein
VDKFDAIVSKRVSTPTCLYHVMRFPASTDHKAEVLDDGLYSFRSKDLVAPMNLTKCLL